MIKIRLSMITCHLTIINDKRVKNSTLYFESINNANKKWNLYSNAVLQMPTDEGSGYQNQADMNIYSRSTSQNSMENYNQLMRPTQADMNIYSRSTSQNSMENYNQLMRPTNEHYYPQSGGGSPTQLYPPPQQQQYG